ncbi:hypothetical protein [Microvirga calopogonii]|uniref:hypothetical protein n=1 Tax=Microvirga calopogonii TaxID=2078013 RepID=UPI0013B44DF1|nr:hypothetical protein [Microvirga calopogonii]
MLTSASHWVELVTQLSPRVAFGFARVAFGFARVAFGFARLINRNLEQVLAACRVSEVLLQL